METADEPDHNPGPTFDPAFEIKKEFTAREHLADFRALSESGDDRPFGETVLELTWPNETETLLTLQSTESETRPRYLELETKTTQTIYVKDS